MSRPRPQSHVEWPTHKRKGIEQKRMRASRGREPFPWRKRKLTLKETQDA